MATLYLNISRQYYRHYPLRHCLVILIIALNLSACQPWLHEKWLKNQIIDEKFVTSPWHRHRLFYLRKDSIKTQPVLVYIEGDGRPWFNHRQISADPTPANPLLLRLMVTRQTPDYAALYVGRACYFQVRDAGCNANNWTFARYSQTQVDSLAWVIERETRPRQQVILIGHSGGGTLATLVAAQLQRPRAVITLAANLDVEAWTEHHGFTPLLNSLDPIRQAPPLDLRQIHWYGTADINILPQWIQRYCQLYQPARCEAVDTGHGDWQPYWPSILQQSLEWLNESSQQH